MELENVTDGLVSKVTSASRGIFKTTRGGVVVTREVAIDLWTRMKQLPVGMTARCHKPSYGIALGHQGSYCMYATICWSCNNIYVWCDDVKSSQYFESQSPEAQKLLSDIRSFFEDDSKGKS